MYVSQYSGTVTVAGKMYSKIPSMRLFSTAATVRKEKPPKKQDLFCSQTNDREGRLQEVYTFRHRRHPSRHGKTAEKK